MKLQILSDLHLEFGSGNPKISRKADILIFAGDITTKPKDSLNFFKWVRKQTEAPIVYILGNHEFYYQVWPTVISKYAEIANKISNFYLLDKDKIQIRGIAFLGTTMWTDFDNTRRIKAIEQAMNDYYVISKPTGGTISPHDILNEFTSSRNWLEQELNQPRKGPIVIITHHGPSFQGVQEKYKNSNINGAFFVNLDDIITNRGPDLWIFGHTHFHCKFKLGKTQLIANPRGYPKEKLTSGFKEKLLMEI